MTFFPLRFLNGIYTDLSAEDKRFAILMKYWGIVRKFGFDKEEFVKQQDYFAESLENIPEGKELYFSLMKKASDRIAPQFHKLDDPQEKEKFLPWREKYASFLVDHFPETVGMTLEMMVFADMFDPDASEGLVISTMELLRPIFQNPDAMENWNLKFCMGMERRVLLPGKEMQFEAKTLDDDTVDVKDFKGKVVLLQYGTTMHEPMLPIYKKLVAALPKEDFVFLDYNVIDAPQIAREKEKISPMPWLTLYRMARDNMQDYVEYYGAFGATFLIDRDGKVVAARSNSIDRLWDELAKQLPNQAERIAELAAEHDVFVQQDKEEMEKYLASFKLTDDDDPNQNPLAAELLELLDEMQHSESLIGTDRQRTETGVELFELIRAIPDLSPRQTGYVKGRNKDLLKQMAKHNIEEHPETNPAVFFAEYEQIIDEQLANETRELNLLTLANEKLEILRHMQQYLKHSPDKQETAQAIQEKFVEVLKIKPMTEHPTGANNVKSHAQIYLLYELERIDRSGSLGLSRTFIGEIVPIFEKAKDLELQAYAQEIGGVKRRASLLGEELEFECILIDGTKFDIKDHRGKIVLVNFWNTHCGPCIREFPNMQAQYDKYKDQGYEMLTYSCGDPLEDLENFFAKNTSYTWLNGSLLMSREQGLKDYSDYYGITANPITFLVDREGKVFFTMVGSDDERLNRELEKVFAETTGQ